MTASMTIARLGDAVARPRGGVVPARWFVVALVVLLAHSYPGADAAHAQSPLTGVKAVATGDGHACALTETGGVKCWGHNGSGGLGDGSTANRLTPVNVVGLSGGIDAIAAGLGHTCAVSDAGGVKCWGANYSGQLGDGSTTQRLTPVDVSGAIGIKAIAAGESHTCVLTVGGGVRCWGDNSYGQLGDGSTTQRPAPVDVVGLSGVTVTAIAAGGSHTCALTDAGGVKCWGANFSGQLGDGSTTDHLAPVDVIGLPGAIKAIAAGGSHGCALTEAGGVTCWGDNYYGQLGDGSSANRLTPVDVVGLSGGITAIAAGGGHSCAVTEAGGAACWGYNDRGQLGDGSPAKRLTPVDVVGLPGPIMAIAAGKSDHTCALTVGGGVTCWGDNLSGQLGDGSTARRLTPNAVVDPSSGIQAIAAGGSHSCALSEAGGVKCWGDNLSGQLGDGSTTNRLSPVNVDGLSGVKAVATGRGHTCALTAADGVTCWGANFGGQLGDGSTTNRLTPVGVVGLSGGVKAVATGRGHSCALTDAGGVKCWGDNFSGQLGDGSTTRRLTPVDVVGLTVGIKAIAAGILHTCALTEAGAVKCWGDGYYGQLGDGSTTTRLTPVDVVGLPGGIQAIAVGNLHTCALTSAGGVSCWGDNFYGQLGDGSTTNRLTPVGVFELAGGVTALSAGYHTCALTGVGGAKCWGDNVFGQLGDGSAGHRTYPMPVLLAASSVLVNAKSRRVHGSAGTFDLLLDAATTSPTTEPRSGGAAGNHTIVFTFDKPVTGGIAAVTAGTATAGTPTFDGNEMIVPLTGVSNQQYVTVSVSDVIAADGGTGGSGSVRVGFLLGDVSQNRVVTVSDLGLVNAQIAQLVSSANFLKDVNASGALTVADKGIANTQITKALPAP